LRHDDALGDHARADEHLVDGITNVDG